MVRLPYCALNGANLAVCAYKCCLRPLDVARTKRFRDFSERGDEKKEKKEEEATVHEFRRCDTPPPRLHVRPIVPPTSFHSAISSRSKEETWIFPLSFISCGFFFRFCLFIFFPAAFHRESAQKDKRTTDVPGEPEGPLRPFSNAEWRADVTNI